jgi:hypothetical protein
MYKCVHSSGLDNQFRLNFDSISLINVLINKQFYGFFFAFSEPVIIESTRLEEMLRAFDRGVEEQQEVVEA